MVSSDPGHRGNRATTTTLWTERPPARVAPDPVTAPPLDVEEGAVKATPSKCPTAQGRKKSIYLIII